MRTYLDCRPAETKCPVIARDVGVPVNSIVVVQG
jgi:uncharacterized protein with ATP-grasp and redox domains